VTAFGAQQGQALKTSLCGQHTLYRRTGLPSGHLGQCIARGGQLCGSYMAMRAEHDLGRKTPSLFAGFGSL
jgi:hypothetical protein